MQGDHSLFGSTSSTSYLLVKRHTLQQGETFMRLSTRTMALTFLHSITHDYRNIETLRKVASEIEGRVCNEKDQVLIDMISKALTEGRIRILEITKSI